MNDGPCVAGAEDVSNKLLEGGRLLELLDDRVQSLRPLLEVRLVLGHHRSLRSEGNFRIIIPRIIQVTIKILQLTTRIIQIQVTT